MTAAFRAAGIDARFVTGNTKESERKALVEAFKAGEFPVLVNCQLFTEGTDIPNVSRLAVSSPKLTIVLDRLHHRCETDKIEESLQSNGMHYSAGHKSSIAYLDSMLDWTRTSTFARQS